MGKEGGNYGKGENVGANSSSQEFFPAWARDATECEEKYQVKRKFGLSSDEVEKRRQIYGRNELEKHEGTSIFKMILKHFNNQLVRILLVVAVTSFVLAWYDAEEGEQIEMWKYVEPLVIFSVLIVNAIVGIWQESNAEKALEALKEIQSKQVNVIRDAKKVINLPAKELVPGDIVELRVGDKVPADMRVLSLISSTVRVEQGSLTGESEAVSKTLKPVAENSDIRGKKCMVFSGTTVVNGNCKCLVTQTGMNTELGKVHSQIHEALQIEDDDTPLKKKLNEFGEVLTIVIGMLCALVWLINVKYFLSWEYVDGWPRNFKFSFIKCKYYLKIAAALAVAAIPEGLPAVITTCLALGTRKMAQKKAIVRKLPSIETLGCTTVICIDKTGTLTTNQMVVSKLVAMGPSPGTLRSFDVEGTTYNPFYGKILDWPVGQMDANLQMIAKVAAVCNDAVVEQSGSHFISTGTPTEAALKVLVEKMGLPEFHRSSEHVDPQRCSQLWNKMEKRIATLEFDRDRKSMGVIVNSSSGRKSLLVKGAVENLLERCTHVQLLDGSPVDLDPYFKKLILRNLHEMSTEGLRCLGFAYKDLNSEFRRYNGDEDHPAHQLLLNPSNYSSIERNLIFVGLVGLWDPPREEVRQAIEDCKAAGIRVMVITGDNKNTAEAICREIGVFESHEDITCKSLTAKEFMDHPDQICHLRQSGSLLFSRAEPSHKHEIVRLLNEDGEVVAMTGDGVNDAPALKLADIGVAMGVVGTEVAKEASDMVLADDNFSTIVAAVGEGRSIFNNIKAFIRYFISSNIGMVASIFLTSTLGIPEVLTPVQLLWSNMVDGIPATALGFNPPDKDAMKKPPRRNNTLITPWILFRHLVIGSYIMIEKVGIFIIWYTRQTFLGIDLSGDGRTLVTYSQLANFGQCSSWKNFTVSAFTAGPQVFKFDTNPCDYFHSGKIKATALSFSLLIVIKLFNSLNAISEDQSLLTMPPWVNPWLLLAASTSLGMHFLIFYVPITSEILRIVPLSLNEWLLVMALSFPVILIDEILKFIGRATSQLWNDRPNKLKAE